MENNVRNMTQGNPLKLIFLFSIPLMLGNVLQQVYVIADTLIISRTLGVDSLAALGSCDWYSFMIISIVQAVTQGFAILLAQDFGASNYVRLQKGYAHTILLCIVFAILITIVALLSIQPMMIIQNTPAHVVDMAKEYLFYYFVGIPAMMLLNFGSAVLRSLGNSRAPLVSMIVSSFINIALDLLFVVVFQMGVKGAAIATVIAQLFAGVYCLFVLKNIDFLHPTKEDFSTDLALDKKLIELSYPMVIQNVIIAVGGILVISRVNMFSIPYIAGYTAVNKLFGLLELAGLSYGYAMITYIGQNYGAKKPERILSGLKASLILGVLSSFVISFVLIVFGHDIVRAFLVGEASVIAEAERVGYQFLKLMSIWLSVLYVLHILRCSLQGFGNTVIPMISGIAEFITRIIFAYVLVQWYDWNALIWAEIAAWFAADFVLIYGMHKEVKQLTMQV